MPLRPAELTALLIVVAIGVADLLLIVAHAQRIDWASYVPSVMAAFGALALGLGYRIKGRSEGIALAAVATGLFIAFTLVASVFNYLLFPLTGPTIDPFLASLDSLVGYHWPAFVESLGVVSWLGPLLSVVYRSSLPQLIVLIILLGFMERELQLHRFLLTGIIGASLSVCIWWIMPSFGPSALFDIPDAVATRVDLVVTPAYGAELRQLAAEGVSIISARDTLGVIAFPSFHTVMALMAVWFTWSTWLRVPFVITNSLMVPAILAHGGHHLVDVLGGAAVFAVALILAKAIAVPVARPHTTRPAITA